jgi:hypothetical protein
MREAMIQLNPEHEELRITLERLRALLENLVVRGLRACGPDELGQLKSYTEHLETSGAGHVAANLADLHARIEAGDRTAAKALLTAQVSVRLLERLLTLRVVREQYAAALAEGDGMGPPSFTPSEG